MHFYRARNPTWFTLCLKPTQTLTNCNSKEMKKKSSAYVLAKVPIPNSAYINISGLVSVGSCIYNIARAPFFHHVSILDCRSHTWQDSPSLPVEVTSLTASVLDGKIYVAGCYEDDDKSMKKNCLEIFDTQTKIWDPVPVLEAKEVFYNSKSASIDGKFHVKTGLEAVAYSPKEGIWNLAGDDDGMRQFMLLYPDSYCVVGNVLYSVFYKFFRWYDTKVKKWRYLKGLGGLPEFPDNVRLRLADNGGKMLVLWDELVDDDSKMMIWIAEIGLVRRKRCEIWGLVEWFHHVVTLPLGYDFVKVLSATV